MNKMAFKKRFMKKGSKKGFKKGKRAVKKPATEKKLMAMVKRATLKVAEPKYTSWYHVKTNVQHNTPVGFILNTTVEMPPQGTGDNQRVGDQINCIGYRVKMLFGQFADRENVTWVVRVVAVPRGTAYTYASWFDPVTNNCMLDDINTDLVKVLKSYTYKYILSPDSNNSEEFTFIKKIWIPYKKIIKFQANAGVQSNDPTDMYLLVSCYDAYGTLSSDNLGYIQMNSQIMFKDP